MLEVEECEKNYSMWFYNNCVNIKLSEHSNPVKNFHDLMGTDNFEEFLRIVIYFIVVVILLLLLSEAATRVFCGKRRSWIS